MSVVVFRDGMLAADMQATDNGMRWVCNKIELRHDDQLAMATVGQSGRGQLLKAWYRAGADPEKWPLPQAGDEATLLIVWSPAEGRLTEYEMNGHGLPLLNPYWAWGSGSKYAMGAMAMGAEAEQAVRIACDLDVYCGHGIQVARWGRAVGLEVTTVVL